MKRLPAALLLVVTLLAGLGMSTSTTRAEPTGVYLALGDSVAVGIGSSLPRERGYAALIGQQVAAWSDGTMRVRNLARSGETATSLRDDGQLDAALQEIALAAANGTPVRAITLTVGGNDVIALQDLPAANRQRALSTYTDALERILADLRAAVGAETPIVLTTLWDPTPLRDADLDAAGWVVRFNDAIVAAAATGDARVADLTPVFAADLRSFTYEPTDIHPTNTGHRVIADLVWQALALDTVAPVLEVPTELTSRRAALTLTVQATDDTDVTAVEVTAHDDVLTVSGPWQTEDDTWVVLLEPQTTVGDAGTLSLTVAARDAAGNVADATISVAIETPGLTPTQEGGAP